MFPIMRQLRMMEHMGNFWSAPHALQPVCHRQVIPGSKSITNRALVLAALAADPSRIINPLRSRDTDLMVGALRSMGVDIAESTAHDGASTLTVTPGSLHGASIDCGLAGTVMRFIPAVATLASGPVHLDGDEQAYARPIDPVLDAVTQLGANVSGRNLPCTVTPPRKHTPEGGTVVIDSSASSQFVTALLLVGARFNSGLELVHDDGGAGKKVPSAPHIQMTLSMLADAGVNATQDSPTTWTVKPGPIAGRDWVIEPDLSNATPFLAAAAVTGGEVTIPHWPTQTTQPGDEIRSILQDMGAHVALEGSELTVSGAVDGQLRGIDRDLGAVGELTPTVAALCALASTPSKLTGIAHLRGHETDRLAALATEINKLGGSVTELEDGLEVTPVPLHGGEWLSYADHRMATAGAIIGLKVDGVQVDNIDTTAKTLPGFAAMWEDMVGNG